jgi:NADH-quinone oxidoreductase subunit F
MRVMDVARRETCGKCVLCREGTLQVYRILKDITEGKAQSGDYELLLELLQCIGKYASCEMAREAASRCLDCMQNYEEEWDKHIRRKRCSNLICKGMYTVYVDPRACEGCGRCVEVCPRGAIAGGAGLIHVIDVQICDKCLACVEICPAGAVKKAGAVLPRVPRTPVPVGSFDKVTDGSSEGGMRRRRRRLK